MGKIELIIENVFHQYLKENVLREENNQALQGEYEGYIVIQNKDGRNCLCLPNGEQVYTRDNQPVFFDVTNNKPYIKNENGATWIDISQFSDFSKLTSQQGEQQGQQQQLGQQEQQQQGEQQGEQQDVDIREMSGDIYNVIDMESDYPISNALLKLVRGKYMDNADRVFKIMRELERIGW